MNIGGPELMIALAMILLLFGGKKLPEIARGLGKAQHEFRAGLTEAARSPEDDRVDH